MTSHVLEPGNAGATRRPGAAAAPSGLLCVASHRGGSLKTTLTALLGVQLAVSGVPTVILDCAEAGGAFGLRDEEFAHSVSFAGPQGPLTRREHTMVPLTVVHAPGLLAERGLLRAAASAAVDGAKVLAIADLPTCGREELDNATRDADMVLTTVPSDGTSFRSIMPFLDALKELRARPGRSFEVRAVQVLTGVRVLQGAQMDRFIARHLSPILAQGHIPFDEALAELVHQGGFPSLEFVEEFSHIHLLAAEVQQLLGERSGAGARAAQPRGEDGVDR